MKVQESSEEEDGFDALEFEALEEYQEEMEKIKRAATSIKGEIINNKVRHSPLRI